MKGTLKAFLAVLLPLARAAAGGRVGGSAGRARAEDTVARAGVGLRLANASASLLADAMSLLPRTP